MKFAIVYNWPGQRNSELELVKRISRIVNKLGHDCTVVDPLGHPLTRGGEHLDSVEFIDARQYDLCLHLHYTNPNLLDTFSYAVNWNPLDYVVRNHMNGNDLPMEDVAYRTYCLASHNALLSAGSEEMDDFAAALNFSEPMQIVNSHLRLHTTCDVIEGLDFPDLKQFKVFYIGVNWERQLGENRHNGVIKRLDESNLVEFYGVKKINGIELWKGVKNYRGELPFDGGQSIVECSNKCGVSLVLHSKAHRDSGLVSTRLFQACAAKTLTICDGNPFIRRHFGDSVLYFKFGADPQENADCILELVEWIRENPEEALEKAKRAHRIFVEKFSLHKEVATLLDHHQENIVQYINEFGTRESSTVDVLYFHKGRGNSGLKSYFTDIATQEGVSSRAVVITLPVCIDEVRSTAARFGLECEIIQWQNDNNESLPLDGRLIRSYLKDFDCSPFFALYSSQCRWHRFHLTQLVRALEGKGATAMAGTFVRNDQYTELLGDYYMPVMESINGHPKGITEQDLGFFRSDRFVPASFLFSTMDFQNKQLYKMLRFFDSGWAFFLILWHYLNSKALPAFVPKLTVMYQQAGVAWQPKIYGTRNQSPDFEASIAYAFFSNNSRYLSLMESSKGAVNKPIIQFSMNVRIQHILRNRPSLLRLYRRCFKLVCSLLNLPQYRY